MNWFSSSRAQGGAELELPSIEAVDIVQEYQTQSGTRRVLDGISFRVSRGERMAIVGRNGAGKSTLIRILAGIQEPTAGTVHTAMSVSWPLALTAGVEGNMSGYDNIRFIARLYGADTKEVFDYVARFSELGSSLHEPVRHYSTGMRMRLAFALSLAIDFDCLLIDEAIADGDVRFQRKCHEEIFERRRDRTLIMAVHGGDFIREYCTSVLILDQGRGRLFHDVKFAIRIADTL
jgi:capsular polysaccharide transport system ATP-binding protein